MKVQTVVHVGLLQNGISNQFYRLLGILIDISGRSRPHSLRVGPWSSFVLFSSSSKTSSTVLFFVFDPLSLYVPYIPVGWSTSFVLTT